MSGTLALASAIAEMDRDTLAALVRARRPHAHASITDPIGLASELLKPDSITRALAPLDRAQLAAVRDPRSADAARIEQLRGLGLLGRDGDAAIALPEVEAVLDEALASAGSDDARRAADLLPSGPVADDDEDVDTSVWFTSALTAVGQAAECLRMLRDRPGKLNRSGSIAVATVKHLAEATAIEPDEVALALAALLRADLITALVDDQLLIAASGSGAWLGRGHVERWIALARAALREMPAPLRAEWSAAARPRCDVRALAASVPEEYPLLPAADLAAVADFARLAEYLGLTVAGRCTDVADALLAGGDAAGTDDAADISADVAAAMPATAAGVYVQPDLSVVVPGPLPPRDEEVLVALARPEHIGVASTRRISEASIAGAYERGLTPATARDAFAR
ncbi:helicase-associated domain-containing protein, partial [Leucobacter chromiiresistens]